MKLFVDTNIFIDVLLQREPFVSDASAIFKLCENGLLQSFIAPITINNIYYICRKSVNLPQVKDFLSDTAEIFQIADMNSDTIKIANSLPIADYEDALQYALAMQNECDFLITRNVKDFRQVSDITVINPHEFIELIIK